VLILQAFIKEKSNPKMELSEEEVHVMGRKNKKSVLDFFNI
jgi:hypothetical protein